MIIGLIMVISTLYGIVVSGTKPVIALYASQLGATPGEIGMLVSVFALLPALLAIRLGRWIDRFGIRFCLALGSVGLLLALLGPIFAAHIGVFVLSQALLGLTFTLLILSAQKRVSRGEGDLDRRVATYTLCGSLGAMIGPSLSGIIYEHFGFQWSYALSAALVLVTLFILLLADRTSWEGEVQERDGAKSGEAANEAIAADDAAEAVAAAERPKESVWRMLRSRDLFNAMLIGGLVLSGRELFAAYFPILAHDRGLSPSQIGLVLSCMGGASTVVRFCQPVLVKTLGRMRLLTGSLYISSVIYVLTPYVSILPLLLIMAVVLGAGLGLGQPLSLSYTISISPPERQGEILGMRITFNRSSQFAIPLIFGALGGAAGVIAIFWGSGLLLLLGGWATREKRKKKTAVSVP